MVLAKLDDGTSFTIESSANVRSCVNVEQFVMTNDPALYQFHRDWMNELLDRTGKLLTATKTHAT